MSSLNLSNGCDLYLVIFFMGADKTNKEDLIFIICGNHEPVIISLDIKNNPVIGKEAGVSVKRKSAFFCAICALCVQFMLSIQSRVWLK